MPGTYSPLTDVIFGCPYNRCNSPRYDTIKKITVHHMAGSMSIEGMDATIRDMGREVSCNYSIGPDGRVGGHVPEEDRSWCSSSGSNDHQAITIEVADDYGAGDHNGWPIGELAWSKLILLCADICKRNSIPKLEFTGDRSGSLTYHYMFTDTGCPGPWVKSHTEELCNSVNRLLGQAVGNGSIFLPDEDDDTDIVVPTLIGYDYYLVTDTEKSTKPGECGNKIIGSVYLGRW